MPGCVEAPRLAEGPRAGLPKRNLTAPGTSLTSRRLPITCLCNANGAVYIAGNGQCAGLFLAKAQQQLRLFVLKNWGGIEECFRM
ncbi:hypothetical protein V1293_002491 [Bradyrhizobium sp. AZCC 1693]